MSNIYILFQLYLNPQNNSNLINNNNTDFFILSIRDI